MRTPEEVKKEQDQVIFDLGFHTAQVHKHSDSADLCKQKIFALATEHEEIMNSQAKEENKKPKDGL